MQQTPASIHTILYDALINSFVKHAVYERIWNTYKHTDKELKKKEASQAEGNHVRHVMKPMKDRLKRVEKKIVE